MSDAMRATHVEILRSISSPSVTPLTQRLRARPDSEHQQMLVRVLITAFFAGYLAITNYFAPREPALQRVLYEIVGFEFVCSLLMVVHLLRHLGESNLRRWFGMLLDYSMITALMVLDGKTSAPLIVVLLWVTIGNGLRYGPKFLNLAVLHAAVAFGTVLALTPYWHQMPFLGGGLLLGLVAIPLYLSGLLRALTRALDSAKQANAAKTRFVATMSHELRSPLNGIVGMSEVLTSTRLSAEQRECADVIQTSAQSLLLVVEDMLNFAAIESGKMQRQDAPFSLQQLVGKTRTMLHPLAANKNLEFTTQIDADVPDGLIGDAGYLLRVLVNLLTNGIKFTDQGSVALHVSMIQNAPNQPSRLHFSVRDTGIGIPEEARERIFQPFEQIESGWSRRYNGTGLGTTIARSLVELMGGTIGMEPNPSGGTHFWVDLPFVVAPAALAPDGNASRTGIPGETNVIAFDNPLLRHRVRVQPLDVLIADDLASNRDVLSRLLKRAGHHVHCASSGEQALDLLAQAEFDAVVLDWHMPETTGLDVIRQLRVMQAGRDHTPVIVLSADVTTETIRAASDNGAFAFLSKPLVIDRLLDALTRIADTDRSSADRHIANTNPAHTDLIQDLLALGTSRETVQIFIDHALADAQQALAQYAQAANVGDWETARDALHALRGVALNLGADDVAKRCDDLRRMTTADLQTVMRTDPQGLANLWDAGRNEIVLHGSDAQSPAVPA